MGKKQNIIEINGRRYDAHTGAALDAPVGKTASASIKPIAVKHAPSDTMVKPVKRAVQHKTSVSRRAAKPATPHKQQKSTTLMRKAVSKPKTGLKRHAKVQSNLSALVEQPKLKIPTKLSLNYTNPKRLEHAVKIKRSDFIKHFNPKQQDYADHKVAVTINRPAPKPAPMPKAVPRQAAPDLDDIFERAIQNATSHLEPAPQKARKHRLSLRRKHVRA